MTNACEVAKVSSAIINYVCLNVLESFEDIEPLLMKLFNMPTNLYGCAFTLMYIILFGNPFCISLYIMTAMLQRMQAGMDPSC